MNSAQWFKEFDLVIHLWQWHGSLFVTDYWNRPSGSGNEDQKKKKKKKNEEISQTTVKKKEQKREGVHKP